ncbi:serine hydrolase [Pontimicrobium sp. SW4]|uniref:beta-lactamase n=1 Tax=Pontimicrobium sp. SW4 TaxID=3153519 RepID=A0AAU7BWG3_9FLAO
MLQIALFRRFTIIIIFTNFGCKETNQLDILKTDIEQQIGEIEGDIAVAFLDLSNEENSILINVDEAFHAASTMKVPVMIELYKQQKQGLINLSDSIVLVNEFKSIADGSPYKMDIGDDSDDVIYSKIGTKQTLYDLMVPMITVSSNLATNVLIEIVDAKKTTQTMRDLGAKNIEVLRGVEDQKAYDLGLSNSTTARDLLVIMEAIANGKAGTKADCEAMLEILKDQQWNDLIPKYLPDNAEVAHKTGSIAGVRHDAAVVYPQNGKDYVLILLSKNLKNFDEDTDKLARISERIYNYVDTH